MAEPQPVPTNLQLVTNLTVVAVGVLYTVGLLIVNTNLARYGLTSLNLARAEYVLAGALWAFLTAVTSSALDYVVREWKACWPQRRRWQALLWVVVESLTAVLAVSYTVIVLSRGAVGYGWDLMLIIFVLSWNGAYAAGLLEMAKAAAAEGFSIRLLAPTTVRGAPNRVYLIIYTLVAIGLYSTVVFPVMPQEFGGGNKPTVNLILTAPIEGWVGRLGLPTSEDGTLGPVKLLLETDTFLIVSRERTGQTNAGSFFGALLRLQPSEGGAVSIEKKAIAAVVHLKAKKAPAPPTPSDIAL